MLRPKPGSYLIRCALFSTCAAILALTSCSSIKLFLNGGEKQVKRVPRPPAPGPYVLIFAFDGAGYDQLMAAINSGKAPAMAGMLGKDEGGGLYEHAYSAPNAVSILPSTTVAAWSAIFTGAPPAQNGVPGNEWFVREDMKFFAPVPVSVEEMDDNRAMVTDNLVGHQLKVPTLFQQAGVKSSVSMNMVYRGADYFTILDPTSMVQLFTEFVAGKEQHSSRQARHVSADGCGLGAEAARFDGSARRAEYPGRVFPGDRFVHASRARPVADGSRLPGEHNRSARGENPRCVSHPRHSRSDLHHGDRRSRSHARAEGPAARAWRQ